MPVNLNNFTTLMGWNQLIRIDYSEAADLFAKNGTFTPPAGNQQVLRVENYNIGIQQTGEAPNYVTGRTDRTAWRKGPIISEGSLSFPFTLPTTGTEASGLAMFLMAAELVKTPGTSFSIESSAHPKISGCKVNNASISCVAEEPVNSSATIWGIIDEGELAEIHSYGDQYRYIWGPTADSSTGTVQTNLDPQTGTIYLDFADHLNASGFPGQGDGADIGGILELEQIPMFDAVSVEGAPDGMFVTGFSLEINNELKRNYTLGSGVDGTQRSRYSPYGLNPTSISANQRTITGTITWQSDYQGYISQVLGVGIEKLIIRVANIKLTLNQCMFNASPPTLSAGDKVTVESSFTALGTGQNNGDDAFDALIIEANPVGEQPPGLNL